MGKYLSVTQATIELFYNKFNSLKIKNWRRGWDSNPRIVSNRRFSRPVLSASSVTSPNLNLNLPWFAHTSVQGAAEYPKIMLFARGKT